MQIDPKTSYAVDDLSEDQAYKLGSSLIVPRPIGWIGTRSETGGTNLAPYSFFNMVSSYPPTFVVGPRVTDRRDTLANIEATGEFTVNVVNEDTLLAMNATAFAFPEGESEFEHCGLTEVAAETINAPLVGEAVANFECKVFKLVPVGSSMLVIGVANRIHIADRLLGDNFRIHQDRLHAIGRHAGGLYSRTATTLFEVERPD